MKNQVFRTHTRWWWTNKKEQEINAWKRMTDEWMESGEKPMCVCTVVNHFFFLWNVNCKTKTCLKFYYLYLSQDQVISIKKTCVILSL